MTKPVPGPEKAPTDADQAKLRPRSGGPVAGSVALIGQPNVGKSTLLNQLVGEKLAIVSPRPQTTRTRVLGVWNGDRGQVVFVDTPGIHAHRGRSGLNQFMMREAFAALEDVELAVWVVDASAPAGHGRRGAATSTGPGAASNDEKVVLSRLRAIGKPIIVAFNKVDRLKDKSVLLPMLERWARSGEFAALVPLSALKGKNTQGLLNEILQRLPEGAPLFDKDVLTDRGERFFAAELVREQLFGRLFDELPYSTAVEIESWTERPSGDVLIEAVILVEREGQGTIVVGRQGAMIKEIGMAARLEITKLLGRPAHLKLQVKVASGWTTSPAALDRLGYR